MKTAYSLPPTINSPLRFLWLELTSRCNLECSHCYADARPHPDIPDVLTTQDYRQLIMDAAAAGCRRVQFIGGEPTLHPALPMLIETARAYQYDFVEVYTNGIHLSHELFECLQKYQVAVATSVYCDDPTIHDRITGRNGSHSATMRTMKRLLDVGLSVRAAVVSMAANKSRVQETVTFLQTFGIREVGVDRVRGVGRGAVLTNLGHPEMNELCGACWQDSLCIGSDGVTSACIMSKAWPVGNAREHGLSAIIASKALASVRTRVYEDVWLPAQQPDTTRQDMQHCQPAPCAPCGPYQPCTPVKGCPPNPCLPNDCGPYAGPCNPPPR